MEGLIAWAACALFAASVVCDLRSRRIPNAIPLALLGLFAGYALTGALGAPADLGVHLAVGAALLGAGYVLFLSGRFGAGDGKLMGVAGVWVGMDGLSLFLFAVAAFAFALSFVALLPLEAARRTRSNLPFAVAIAPPALVVMIPRALLHGIPI